MRPIAISTGSSLQQLCEKLQTFTEKAEPYKKNANQFMDLMKKEYFQSEDLLLYTNLVSMFTNVPIE